MKFSFEIRPDERAILVRLRGACSIADVLQSARRLWADPRYSRDYRGLVDLSDGSLSIGFGELRELLAAVAEEPQTSSARWAAVAGTPFATACGVLYARAIQHRHEFGVFSTWEAACGFVGFPPDLFPERENPARDAAGPN